MVQVLLITGSYPPQACGVGDYSLNLATALTAIPEVNVTVLTSIGSSEQCNNSTAIKVLPIMQNWSMVEAIKIIRIIWEYKPDIVHIQYPTQGYKNALLPWLLPAISYLMRRKVVQTWHEIYRYRPNLRMLLQAIIPSELIVVRPEYRKQLHPVLQKILHKRNINLIRNASAIPKIILNDEERISIRNAYLDKQKRLIVFFGFIYEYKGVDLLFDIADPDLDQIVIAGQFGNESDYAKKIENLATNYPWTGKVTITGFLSPNEVASLLSVADAVVIPLRIGGGEWNTSIHSAVLQGTFVLTTSESARGFDIKHNVYYSEIDNIQEMKVALNCYVGKRREYDSDIDKAGWQEIAIDHYSLYKALLST